MIYIANPIYDSVFKYMLEDEGVAKRFIGIIIGKKITKIKLLPQEKTYQKEKTLIVIQRLDFVAEIVEENGKKSKVLIEIQKSNKSYHADLIRFRGYLAQQYQKDDLPIITIYILGFNLEDLESPAVYVAPECKDLYYEKPIDKKPEFVDRLTHGMYVIQVPRLKPVLKNKLTQLLDLFNQEYRLSTKVPGNRTLNVPYLPKDKEIQAILKRLEKANADEALREKISDEEFADMAYEEMFGSLDRKVIVLQKRAENAKKKLRKTQQELEHKNQELEKERQQTEQTNQKLRETAMLLKSLGVPIKQISEKTGLSIAEIEKL